MADDDDMRDQDAHIGSEHLSVSLLTRVAEEAAERAVKKTFVAMGIDTEEPMEAQADMAFLRSTRQRCNSINGRIIFAVIASVIALLLSATGAGIVSMLHPHP